jgi:hypothetical protein
VLTWVSRKPTAWAQRIRTWYAAAMFNNTRVIGHSVLGRPDNASPRVYVCCWYDAEKVLKDGES